MYLSKSQFIRGIQCKKSLWLLKNKPELRTPPDDAQQIIFDTGKDVGFLAQQLFPGGVELVFDYEKIVKNILKTKELIKNGTETIYEATFQYNDVLVMVDILHHDSEGWHLYEVKSSTSLKDVNENDIAVQYYVLKGSGIELSSASLIHINNQYTREGELNIHELFTTVDITETVISKQQYVNKEIQKMKKIASKGTPEPSIRIGPQCFDPYDCDYYDYCWQHVPEKSVFNLTRMNMSKKFELYTEGIVSFSDIPDDMILTDAQRMQVDAELNGSEFIDPQVIKDFIGTLTEPLGFLDFETFQQAIPSFNKQKPYEQIPFQYSLHILDDTELTHTEYLGLPGQDPRENFIKQLIEDTNNIKTIIVYNMGFEKMILKSLSKNFPKYESEIKDIIDRITDLMIPFRKKAYYVAAMEGSYSIKKVLPALIPELSYANMDIGDGVTAMQSYAKITSTIDNGQIEKVKNDLLEYCRLDTLAMVEILSKLKEICSN